MCVVWWHPLRRGGLLPLTSAVVYWSLRLYLDTLPPGWRVRMAVGLKVRRGAVGRRRRLQYGGQARTATATCISVAVRTDCGHGRVPRCCLLLLAACAAAGLTRFSAGVSQQQASVFQKR